MIKQGTWPRLKVWYGWVLAQANSEVQRLVGEALSQRKAEANLPDM